MRWLAIFLLASCGVTDPEPVDTLREVMADVRAADAYAPPEEESPEYTSVPPTIVEPPWIPERDENPWDDLIQPPPPAPLPPCPVCEDGPQGMP
jgi:hypothetical protein